MRKYFHYSSKRFPAGSASGTTLQKLLEEPQICSRSAVGCSERRRYCSVRRRDVEMIFTRGGQWSSRSSHYPAHTPSLLCTIALGTWIWALTSSSFFSVFSISGILQDWSLFLRDSPSNYTDCSCSVYLFHNCCQTSFFPVPNASGEVLERIVCSSSFPLMASHPITAIFSFPL